MKRLTPILLLVACSFSALPVFAGPGGPTTVGTVNVVGDGFQQCETQFVDAGAVFFLEVNYDGISTMTINTRGTTDPIDTELGLYDEAGILVDSNDDINFGAGNVLSELRLEGLPAGTYFLGVGLFNTVYGADFDATSTSTDSGDVVVKVVTDTFPVLENIINVDLNYNFNGIVHADEPSDPINNPDDPNGFRSISDRALDFRNGVPSDAVVDRYVFVESGGELDIVHLGNRNTVDNGNHQFDLEPDFDAQGIQPDWLADPDQTGRQTTMLKEPVLLSADSQVTLLFQISNGGGSFDVVVGMTNGMEFSTTVTGPDWFGPFDGQPNIGAYDGAFGVDFGFMDPLGENTLLMTESIIDLGSMAGAMVDSISFENATSPAAGIAVLATNIVGTTGGCFVGDVNGDGVISLLDVGPFVDLLTSGGFQCEADINGDGVVSLLDVGPFVDLLSQ